MKELGKEFENIIDKEFEVFRNVIQSYKPLNTSSVFKLQEKIDKEIILNSKKLMDMSEEDKLKEIKSIINRVVEEDINAHKSNDIDIDVTFERMKKTIITTLEKEVIK